jgi:hypothetical protein
MAVMRTLYLRDVPDEVIERLVRLARREGSSVSAVAVRELTESYLRVENPALLGALPDLDVEPTVLIDDLDAERGSR